MYSFLLLLSSWIIPGIGKSLQITYFFPLFIKRFRVSILTYNYKDINILILVIIIILSQINLLFSGKFNNEIFSFQHYLTFTILTPFAYLLCRAINVNDLKVIIYLILIECLFVFYESFRGVSTIYANVEGFEEFKNVEDLIYFNRPYGLSNNASGVAEKLLIGFLCLSVLGKRLKYSFLYYITFSVALIINFGRTAITCVLFYFFLEALHKYLKSDTLYKLKVVLALLVILIGLYYILDASFFSEIIRQYTRGSDKLDLSGRDEIWASFIERIRNNLFFGNGSAKIYIDYYGTPAQAHNSFLMAIGTHGLVIFSLYIVMLVININRYNFKYVLTILLFSMTQYAIYWGISFMDIFYLFFLTSPLIKELGSNKNNTTI